MKEPNYELTIIDLVNFMRKTGVELTLSMEDTDTLFIRLKKDILQMNKKVGLKGLHEDAQTAIIYYNLDSLVKPLMDAYKELDAPVPGIDE